MSQLSASGRPGGAAIVAAMERLWDVTLADIESHWMDLMIKRFLRELNRQLLLIENEKAEEARAHKSENARVLASLEQTLERLARLEAQREAIRKSRGDGRDLGKILEGKFRRIAAGQPPQAVPGEPG